MKILVTHLSKTGQTRTVAEVIASTINAQSEYKVDLMSVKEAMKIDLSEYEAVVVGSWIHRNTFIPKAADFVKIIHNKKLILFCTAGADPKSKYGDMIRANISSLVNADSTLLDCFVLHGYVHPRNAKMIRMIPDFVVSAESKKLMLDVMEGSRKASTEEIEAAAQHCLSLIK